MDLSVLWYVLVWFLLVGYAVLDGFDLGVGALHLFARNDRERLMHVGAIGPVWDGNEVWLLTGGGALFAAFPKVYATVFSGMYLALMVLLLGLIFRAVSLEFRGQVDGPRWRRVWDWAFGLGSLVPALLFGVAMGNIVRGLPIEADGTANVAFLSLLNPYSLLIGALSVVMLVMHGAAYMAVKTEGELQQRMGRWISGAWMAFVVLLAAAFVGSFLVSASFAKMLSKPLCWVFLIVLVAAVVYVPIARRAERHVRTFLATCATIISVMGLTAACLFPRVVPSSIHPDYSLTVQNASSTPTALTAMLVIAAIGMPLVILYTAYVYRTFSGKVVVAEGGY